MLSRYMRWALACIALFLVAAMLIRSDDARAQSQGGDVEKARQLMEEGQSLFKEGRYRDAMTKFEEAYKTQPFSAFVYNAAVAAEKSGDLQRAIARYQEYLQAEPDSPYADQVKAKITKLEEDLKRVPEPAGGGAGGDGGAPPAPEPKAPIPADAAAIAEIRSLVLVESDPSGAPLRIYERTEATAPAFNHDGENPGWREIVSSAQTPKDLSLAVGHYHVVIEKFQDYNRVETDINLQPGHVYTFKAALSQGAFLGQLLLKTNVENAKVFVDDPPPHKAAPLFRGTDSRDLNKGEHELWIEAPGYEPAHRAFTIEQGKTTELSVELERVRHGFLVIDGNAEEIEVEIDDRPYGPYKSTGDPIKIKLPAGKHKVVLDADGRKEFVGEVDIPKGQELPLHATLVESYPRGKAIALGVVAIGCGIGGIFLHIEAEKPIGDPHNEDIHRVFDVSRYVAWGASGLFAGLAIFFAVYDPYDDSLVKLDDARELPEGEQKPRTQKSAMMPIVVPLLSSEVAGIGISGVF